MPAKIRHSKLRCLNIRRKRTFANDLKLVAIIELFPGTEQSGNPFFICQAANKKRITAVTRTYTGIKRMKFGFT